MQTKTVSFRIDIDKVDRLDSIADVQQRDRSFLINEAIDQYLSLKKFHQACIRRGIEDVTQGRTKTSEEVRALSQTWTKHT